MDREQIFQKVLQIIKPYVKNDQAFQTANESTRFIEDLKINSARLVDIVLDFEDKFSLSISDQEAEEILTIGKAIDLISLQTVK